MFRREAWLEAQPDLDPEKLIFIAGLRLGGMAAPMLLDAPMNGGAFRAYAEPVLVPELRTGGIVVCRNHFKAAGNEPEQIESAPDRSIE